MNPLDAYANPFDSGAASLFRHQPAPAVDPYRNFFVAKLTAKTSVSGVWNYSWTRQTHDTATGQSTTDANPPQSGSYSGGVANSPAIEVNNTSIDLTSSVYVLMRQKGIVNGQMYYEFEYAPPGGGLKGYRFTAAVSADSTYSPYSVPLTVPRGDYYVTGVVTFNFASGAARIHYGLGATNHGASPASPKVPNSTTRLDGQANDFFSMPVSQIIVAGQYDDDGSTADMDIKLYMKQDTGSGTLNGISELNAIPITDHN